jgi:hypothetical protein
MRLTILIILINVVYPATSLGQGDWKLKRDKEGITIYVREQADSPLKEYKARAIIANPIQQVFEFMSDYERYPEWVFRCAGLTIIEDQREHRIVYQIAYDIPWPMKARDLTVESVITVHDQDRKIEKLTKTVQVDFPSEEGVIRMPEYREFVVLEEIDSLNTLFITEGYSNPGGKVTPRLVNMFLVDGIFDSVVRLREILQDQEK